MNKRSIILFVLSTSALLAMNAGAQTIDNARYSKPVDRYGHFALGRPHEYAQLLVTTTDGRIHVLNLPDDEVFEDRAPRIVRLAVTQDEALLTIVSNRGDGSRLALIRLSDGQLLISAQSKPIGTPMRWLNPVGVADLDGDGQAEIAAVITPHIGGLLKVYRERGDSLVEIATLAGFSNHVYHSDELALSMPLPVGDQMYLLVPDYTRRFLRIVALQDNALIEKGRCHLVNPIDSELVRTSETEVSINSAGEKQTIEPVDCLH